MTTENAHLRNLQATMAYHQTIVNSRLTALQTVLEAWSKPAQEMPKQQRSVDVLLAEAAKIEAYILKDIEKPGSPPSIVRVGGVG